MLFPLLPSRHRGLLLVEILVKRVLHSSEAGTMPATWAELRRCLVVVLEWFEEALPDNTENSLVPFAIRRWQELAAKLPLPLPPDDAERTELLG